MRFYLANLNSLLLIWALGLHSAAAEPISEIEKTVYDATNIIRQNNVLRNLEFDPLLAEIARGHSQDMLELRYFSHNSPNQLCETVRDRLRFGHEFCLSSAENLHKCQGCDLSLVAQQAVDSWMASPPHRRNLLNGQFNRVGIGVAVKNQTVLFTQLFSYEPLAIDSLVVTPEGAGFQVEIGARVRDGPTQGSFFVDGKRCLDWVADPDGRFAGRVQMLQAGQLEIGQTTGPRQWQVETSIPIPLPEKHFRHSWLPEFPGFFENYCS